MNYRTLFAIGLIVAGVGGCAKDGAKSADHPPIAALDPTPEPQISANTHYAAGQVAESQGNLDAAVAQYRAALQLDKNHSKSMYRLGCVYAIQKKTGESVAMWKRYLKATDQSAFAYSNLAFAEELAGDPAAAEADYKHGIDREPRNAACRTNYGLMLARHGRIAEATLQFQAVLSPAEIHYNLATVYQMSNRREQAKLEYEQALALDPQLVDAKAKLDTLGNLSRNDDD